MRRRVLSTLVVTLFCVPLFAQTGRVKLPGMQKAGTITRDSMGIAHVYALSERDLLFLQGWVHAEDRFFQMDYNRRLASGTLAELVGQPALPSDVQLRTLGLRRSAEASLSEMAPDTRALLAAYAAGVNAWLAQNDLPLEHSLLEISQVPEWTPVDSLAIAKLITFGLSFDLDTDRTIALLTWQAVGEAAGFDGTTFFFEDLYRIEPFGDASTVPDANGSVGRPMVDGGKQAQNLSRIRDAVRAIDPVVLDLAREVSASFGENEFLAAAIDRDFFTGSNEWGISGNHTDTGRPMIANDPHLALDVPSTFYPMGLQAGDINAFGMGFPGAPYVILGHTPGLAWGATTNPMDVTDAFIEELVVLPQAPAGLGTRHGDRVEALFPILQTWRVNVIGDETLNNLQTVPAGGAIPPATLIVPRRNAPIVSLDAAAGTAISIQYTGFYATQEVEFFRRINRASTLDEFREALVYFDVGSQNWAVVDTQGNYGYFTSGELPLREDLEAGHVAGLPPFFLRNGPQGNDWIRDLTPEPGQSTPSAILPFAEMPQVVNPAGFFVNANNDPAGTNLDNNALNQTRSTGGILYLNAGYDGFRATRITQMITDQIHSGETISFDDMQAMQADTLMIDAQYFVPWITQAFANAQSSQHPLLAQFARSPAIGAAVARLAAWDFTTPTGIPEGFDASDVNGQRLQPTAEEIADSVAATIYSVWRGQFIGNTVDALIGGIEQQGGLGAGSLPRPGNQEVMNLLRHLLDNWEETQGVGAAGLPFFNLPPAAGNPPADIKRDIILLQSIAGALELITSEEFAPAFGRSTDMNTWNWGKLHRVVFDHPLGGALSIPPAGGLFPPPLPGLAGIPTDGGFGTVDASGHSVRANGLNEFMFGSGPVRRFVAEGRSEQISAETSLPGGPKGEPGEFYFNLLPMWLTNDAFPTTLGTGPRIPWIR